VLVLHFQEEMSLAEVAAILEIPLGTVKSRLAFGLTALRKHLQMVRVCTVIVAGYITRMTKTILRAIELMSNEPPR
jgi:hypothetical protein